MTKKDIPRFSYSQSFLKKALKKFFIFNFGGQTSRLSKKQRNFFWGPHNVQSGNPGVVRDDIAVDFLSSQILGVDRIEMEIMFLIGYWPFRGKVNFYIYIFFFKTISWDKI